MSVEAWLNEYYDDVDGAETWTDLRCFNHTRTEYIGTRKENLDRHGVVKDGNMLFIPADEITGAVIQFSFSVSNCSLCSKYYNSDSFCKRCPIMIYEGFDCGDPGSAYRSFVDDNDPEQMISLMSELIARCDENGKYVPKEGGE